MDWIFISIMVGALVLCVVAAFFGGPKKPKPSGLYGDASLATDDMLKHAGLIGAEWGQGIRIGNTTRAAVIRYLGQNSILLVGPPGTGKQTTFATTALIEAENTAFFVLDPKVELLPITHRRRAALGRVRWIVPFKEGLPPELAHYVDESDSYNPLWFLDAQSESYVINCDTLAEILVASEDGESRNAGFFTGNAQTIVSGVLMQLVENYRDQATLPELASIVCSDRLFAFAATALKTGSQFVKDRLSVVATPDAAEMKGGLGDILRTAREQLKWLSNPAIARILQTPKEPWRFEDLKCGEKPASFYVGVSAKYLPTSRRLFRLLLGCAIAELQTTPPGVWPVCCLADEFALLGKVEIFRSVFAEARGHGFKMIAIVQNIGQLISTYGQEGYRNILSGSEIQLFLPPRDLQTATEISRLAGKRTVVTEHKSYSAGGHETTGYGEAPQDVIDPHKVMALKADEFIMFAPGLVKDAILGRRRPYWEFEDIGPWCDTNPYNPTTPPGFVKVLCPHCGRVFGPLARSLQKRVLGVPIECFYCGQKWKVEDMPEGETAVAVRASGMTAYLERVFGDWFMKHRAIHENRSSK